MRTRANTHRTSPASSACPSAGVLPSTPRLLPSTSPGLQADIYPPTASSSAQGWTPGGQG